MNAVRVHDQVRERLCKAIPRERSPVPKDPFLSVQASGIRRRLARLRLSRPSPLRGMPSAMLGPLEASAYPFAPLQSVREPQGHRTR